MSPDALISELRNRGVSLIPDGDRLRCRPRSVLTDQDLELLRAHKAAVLAALAGDDKPPTRRLVCFACHDRRFWRSIHGVVVCGNCHPPASERLVREWLPEAENG